MITDFDERAAAFPDHEGARSPIALTRLRHATGGRGLRWLSEKYREDCDLVFDGSFSSPRDTEVQLYVDGVPALSFAPRPEDQVWERNGYRLEHRYLGHETAYHGRFRLHVPPAGGRPGRRLELRARVTRGVNPNAWFAVRPASRDLKALHSAPPASGAEGKGAGAIPGDLVVPAAAGAGFAALAVPAVAAGGWWWAAATAGGALALALARLWWMDRRGPAVAAAAASAPEGAAGQKANEYGRRIGRLVAEHQRRVTRTAFFALESQVQQLLRLMERHAGGESVDAQAERRRAVDSIRTLMRVLDEPATDLEEAIAGAFQAERGLAAERMSQALAREREKLDEALRQALARPAGRDRSDPAPPAGDERRPAP